MAMKRRAGEDTVTWTMRANLIRLMKEQKFSTQRLADLYGCTRANIYGLRNGLRGIGPEPLAKLAQIFGVAESEFLKEIEEPVYTLEDEVRDYMDELIEELKERDDREEILEHFKRQILLLKRVK